MFRTGQRTVQLAARTFSTTARCRDTHLQEAPPTPIAPKPAAAATVAAPGSHTFYEIPPEKDPMLQFLTTMVMKHGRHSRAQKIVSEMLLHIHTLTRAPPLPIVHSAILKASPAVRVKSTKVGARSIVRPVALSERQRTRQGIEWIIEASHNKPGMEMQKRLAKEMIAVVRGDSAALSKKEQVHKGAMIARGSLQSR
ncbi:ribosomal protein S7 domain-containing protein [Coprinopsis sp. MPI-PUGE-AT-0042]|nr:ribosomal protein S7 domain-containing protein [Coprinopsis sp. MPI-PUGE-AT-0042]